MKLIKGLIEFCENFRDHGWLRSREWVCAQLEHLTNEQFSLKADIGAVSDVLETLLKEVRASKPTPTLKVKLIDGAQLPKYQTTGAAGFDLAAVEDRHLTRNHWTLVRTGVFVQIPEGWEGQIRGRSGLSRTFDYYVGTIDSDYRGELGVMIKYVGPGEHYNLRKGMRLAQMVIAPAPQAQLVRVEELDLSPRGTAGFGSSGTGLEGADRS